MQPDGRGWSAACGLQCLYAFRQAEVLIGYTVVRSSGCRLVLALPGFVEKCVDKPFVLSRRRHFPGRQAGHGYPPGIGTWFRVRNPGAAVRVMTQDNRRGGIKGHCTEEVITDTCRDEPRRSSVGGSPLRLEQRQMVHRLRGKGFSWDRSLELLPCSLSGASTL